MADRVIDELSDTLLRSGVNFKEIMKFLQLNSWDVPFHNDDFLTGVLTTNKYTSVADSGATAFAVLAPTASANEHGVIRGVTGTTNDEVVGLSLARQYAGQYNAVFAVRYRLSSASDIKLEIGFRDTVVSATGTVLVLDTPTFSATDGVCWAYDTDSANDRWQSAGVANSVASTSTELASGVQGALPIADTYQTMVVSMLEGNAYFSRYDADGRKQGESHYQAGTQTATVNLAPAVFCQTRSTSSVNIDLDFFKVWQLRRS